MMSEKSVSVLHSRLRFGNNFAIFGNLWVVWDITLHTPPPPQKKYVSHHFVFTFALLSDLV
jgi:hypothetical protein